MRRLACTQVPESLTMVPATDPKTALYPSKLTEEGSAKFFVKGNGDSILQERGVLNDREINKIQSFIKDNYQEMYNKWQEYSKTGFYLGK